MGSDATNPDNMMITDDYIFTVNNKNWSGASFSKVDLSTNSSTTINVSDVSTGCGTSCLRGDKINFQISMDSVLLEWDPATLLSSGNPLGINQNFYDLAYDEVNNYLYASETDYSTYGKVHIYDADNNLVSEFDCGVSPGTIVFDVRNTTSIVDYSFNQTQDDVFFDLFGRKINQIENQPKGVYIRSGKKIFRQ